MSNYTILYTILHFSILSFTILHCTTVYYTVQDCYTTLYRSVDTMLCWMNTNCSLFLAVYGCIDRTSRRNERKRDEREGVRKQHRRADSSGQGSAVHLHLKETKINDQQVALTTLKLRARTGPERLCKHTPRQSVTACKLLSNSVVSGRLIAVLKFFSSLESWTFTYGGFRVCAHWRSDSCSSFFGSVASSTYDRELHLQERL